MVIRMVRIFPDLMNLYGGWANAELLRRTLEGLGQSCEIVDVRPGDERFPAGADFICLGAGTERAALFALEKLRPHSEALKSALASGAVLLFCGTGMDLIGSELKDASGAVHKGLGLADFTAEQTQRRITEDVIGETALFPEPIVGFMNKCTLHRGIETPLIEKLSLGFGNDAEGGAEGLALGTLFASCLTGPILVKNPALLKHIARLVLRHAGLEAPREIPVPPHLEDGYRVTAEALRERAGK